MKRNIQMYVLQQTLPSKKYAYVLVCISGGSVAVYVATRSICFSSIRTYEQLIN